MIALLLTLACAAVGWWNIVNGVFWMAWICFFMSALCLLHFIEWLVRDAR